MKGEDRVSTSKITTIGTLRLSTIDEAKFCIQNVPYTYLRNIRGVVALTTASLEMSDRKR